MNGNDVDVKNDEPDISEIDAATIDQLSGLVDEADEHTEAERAESQMGLYGM